MPDLAFLVYATVVLGLFLAYGTLTRRGQLRGRAIPLAGAGVGLVALVATVLLLKPQIESKGVPFAVLLLNAGSIGLVSAYCILLAVRQARVEVVSERQAGGGRVAVRVSSPWRLADVDALVVPTATTLRALVGPSVAVLMAAGKETEQAVRAAAPAALDKVVTTPAGRLPVGKIYHVAVHEPMRPVEASRLRRGLEAGAQQARKGGATRVGLAFGPARGLSLGQTAAVYAEAALRQARHLPEVVLIALDGRGEKELVDALRQAEPPQAEKAGAGDAPLPAGKKSRHPGEPRR